MTRLTSAQKPPESAVFENHAMRDFASHFATGIGVITASTQRGRPVGLTMNAISSLSMNPPLYLVCLDERSNTLQAILATKKFGINFLCNDQQALCVRFAAQDDDKFADIAWHEGHLAVPLLDGALATAVCTLHAVHPGGDHRIVVGSPQTCQVYGGTPLLYFRGALLE